MVILHLNNVYCIFEQTRAVLEKSYQSNLEQYSVYVYLSVCLYNISIAMETLWCYTVMPIQLIWIELN